MEANTRQESFIQFGKQGPQCEARKSKDDLKLNDDETRSTGRSSKGDTNSERSYFSPTESNSDGSSVDSWSTSSILSIDELHQADAEAINFVLNDDKISRTDSLETFWKSPDWVRKLYRKEKTETSKAGSLMSDVTQNEHSNYKSKGELDVRDRPILQLEPCPLLKSPSNNCYAASNRSSFIDREPLHGRKLNPWAAREVPKQASLERRELKIIYDKLLVQQQERFKSYDVAVVKTQRCNGHSAREIKCCCCIPDTMNFRKPVVYASHGQSIAKQNFHRHHSFNQLTEVENWQNASGAVTPTPSKISHRETVRMLTQEQKIKGIGQWALYTNDKRSNVCSPLHSSSSLKGELEDKQFWRLQQAQLRQKIASMNQRHLEQMWNYMPISTNRTGDVRYEYRQKFMSSSIQQTLVALKEYELKINNINWRLQEQLKKQLHYKNKLMLKNDVPQLSLKYPSISGRSQGNLETDYSKEHLNLMSDPNNECIEAKHLKLSSIGLHENASLAIITESDSIEEGGGGQSPPVKADESEISPTICESTADPHSKVVPHESKYELNCEPPISHAASHPVGVIELIAVAPDGDNKC